MAGRLKKRPPHPIAKRLPMDPPPRIETNVRRESYDSNDHLYYDRSYYDNSVVCNCFPRTSTKMVPSMFYDKIVCPHQHNAHIQPAQETQFNYPWTANSVSRRRARGGPEDDELSERLSLISEEDEQLRFSPPPLRQKPPDVLSIQTAPPIVAERDFEDPREMQPPYTAPVNDPPVLTNGRRVMSVEDIRNPAYRSDGMPRSRGNVSPTKSRLSNRQFTGSYVDPREYPASYFRFQSNH